MTTRSWIRNRFAGPATRPTRKATRRINPLLVEQLEDRAVPAAVGLVGGNSNSDIAAFLTSHGNTVVDNPASYTGLDAVILLRTDGTTNLVNFVNGGGLLVTEWTGADWALGAGNLLNADVSGGGFIGTGTPVTFTAAGVAAGLAIGVNNPYSNGGATEFFRTIVNIGSGVDILGTRAGNIPVIIGGTSGAGRTLVIDYDWADGFAGSNADGRQLLLNALNYQTLSISSLSPHSAVINGANNVALTVTGVGFQTDSVVKWNGAPLATSYMSSTQLTAVVPASNLARTYGSANITVTNPTVHPGTSAPSPFFLNTPTATVPTLTNPTSASVTFGSATLGGTVAADNGSLIQKRGILYAPTATNANPTVGGTGVIEVDDAAATTGAFSENVTGLNPNTAYSFVAFATNDIGTAYTSPVSTFNTPAAAGAGWTFSGAGGSSVSGYTLGSRFSTTGPLTISQLGFWDGNSLGLAGSHPVGLWTATGTLLASTTVLPSDPLLNGFRYHALTTPLTLPAGTYSIGGFYGVTDEYGFNPTSFTTLPGVTFLGYAGIQNSGGLTFPNGFTGSGIYYFGADFLVVANQAPVAVNDSYSVAEDTPLTVSAAGVLANDTDVDGDALTAILVSGPAHGSLTLSANGSFTYRPADDYFGSDSFTYKPNDGTVDGNVVTVTLNVTPVNDAPIANPDIAVTNEDTAVSIPVLANDLAGPANESDQSLTITHLNGQAAAVGDPIPTDHGTVVLNADGTVTYTPAPNYNGPDGFTYTIQDSGAPPATATTTGSVTINPVNDPPIANDDSYVIAEDGTLTVPAGGVLGNDTDVDGDTLQVAAPRPVDGPAHGNLTLNADGSFTYTPFANYNGPDSFTYRATDGIAESNLATVRITVTAVNDAPVGRADAAGTLEDTVATGNVLANDSDVDGDPLAAVLVTGPAHGLVTLNGDGSYQYTPAPNFNGTDSFTYRASDGSLTSAETTVTITVIPVNDPPVASDDTATVAEDGSVTTGVLANDTDVDGDTLTVLAASAASHGTVTFAGTSVTYTPNANYNGPDSFTYTVNDGQGGTATATVTVTVTPVNDAPTANGQSATTAEDTALAVTLTGSDVETAAGSLIYTVTAGPAHGTLSGSGPNLTFTPDPNYNGLDSFQFTVTDTGDGSSPALTSAPATVTIGVTPVNDAPVLAPISDRTIDEGSPLTFTASATDIDLPPDTLTYSLNGAPAGAAIDPATGAFIWTPTDNGTFTFDVVVMDNGSPNLHDSKTVTVTVNNVNPTPAITGAPASSPEGTPINLGSTVTDPGSADTFALAWSVTKNGSPYAAGSGAGFTFTPDDNGTYVVTLTATDDDGGVGTDARTIAVTNVAPTLTLTGAASVNEGSTYTLGLSSSDPGADTITSWAINWGDGTTQTVTGNPAAVTHTYADGTNSYTVSATATDEDATYAAGNTVNVTVNNVAPTLALSGGAAINEGSAYTLGLSSHDPGPDTVSSWLVNWGDGTHQTVAGNPSAVTHVYADNGAYTVSATATDEDGTYSAGNTVTATVNNVAPTVGPITAPIGPRAVGSAVSVSAAFSDPGTADTHTATWDWGDGTTPGTVTEANGSGSVANSHSYTAAGVYTVTLTVTDKDGASAHSTYQYVVVYDPSAGFVTGGGWIDSPAGAYAADPSLTGKANFGFVARYQRGTTIPTGNTQFQFQAGNFSFKSTSYDWLVVAGAKAQFKGVGTVNGAGSYGFLLTAVDGQVSGGGGTDKFRIKVWDKVTGAVVYDNQTGATDDAAPATALGGGNIQIQAGAALTAATGPAAGTGVTPLTDAQLRPIVREAVRRWNLTGLTAAERRLLRSVTVRLADLEGANLGRTDGTAVTIDRDAAGYGWFVDKTPGKDTEFTTAGDQGEQGHMDLLTTVMHEIGHAIGRDHADAGVMDEFLATGERQSPAPAHGLTAPVAKPAPKAGWLLSRFWRR